MRYLLLLSFVASLLFISQTWGVGSLPGGSEIIGDVSIHVANPGTTNVYDASRFLGLQVLRAAKLLVSGFALIWLVLIGAYMIVYSENEEKVKAQKSQITYMLIGFLFLNVPSLVYTLFFGGTLGQGTIHGEVIGDTTTVNLWDPTAFLGANGFIPQLIGFFEVLIFGVAILTFTYGFFRLMVSGGDEEIRKKAKNQIVYGVIALLFLSFVRYWGAVIAKGAFFTEYATLGNKILGLALYFAPPIAIGFLVYAGFILITAGGDEERVKKAKSIFLNTLIAALILLGTYSFVSDLASFSL